MRTFILQSKKGEPRYKKDPIMRDEEDERHEEGEERAGSNAHMSDHDEHSDRLSSSMSRASVGKA